jgi:hypothetical protein
MLGKLAGHHEYAPHGVVILPEKDRKPNVARSAERRGGRAAHPVTCLGSSAEWAAKP